jgi:excisionase family DNA binding protein
MTAAAPAKDRETETRPLKDVEPLNEADAQLVNAAQRCIMAALDHSRAQKIVLRPKGEAEGNAPVLELPPDALKVIARVLGLMGERKPFALIPRNHEMTTQEVANLLNVSRPFVIKEIEAGRLTCHMVGTHRRVAYEEAARYRDEMAAKQDAALQDLADQAQALGLGY